jgi:hypothetical protein
VPTEEHYEKARAAVAALGINFYAKLDKSMHKLSAYKHPVGRRGRVTNLLLEGMPAELFRYVVRKDNKRNDFYAEALVTTKALQALKRREAFVEKLAKLIEKEDNGKAETTRVRPRKSAQAKEKL